MADYWSEYAPVLISKGFRVTPIMKSDKRPAISAWQKTIITLDEVPRFRGHGVGVLCGVGDVPIVAIDIDTKNERLATRFAEWCLEHLGFAPERVGEAPKRLLVYRAAEPGWAKAASAWFADPERQNEKGHRLEVLAKGQQFVAYHIHPGTGKPYEWTDVLGGLAATPVEILTQINLDQLREAIATFERMAEEEGLVRVGGAKADNNEPGHENALQVLEQGGAVPAGFRNDTLFRLASSLRRKGLSIESIEAALLIENAKRCDPPMKDEEVRKIARSVGRYPQGRTSSVEQFKYGDGFFVVSSKGVEYQAVNQENGEVKTTWICDEIRILAETRDSRNANWGRLLEWEDRDGKRHRWAMPMELLQGDGIDVRRELSSLGVKISVRKNARDLLNTYLQLCHVDGVARCVDRVGWYESVFVLPDEIIGESDEYIVLQSQHVLDQGFAQKGTTDEWRDSVAALAAKNSRLVFVLSVAFAAPLAYLAGEDSGGFHLRGASSTGKTTALKVAASVWGSPNTYPRLWRATSNGLEGLAAVHNDGLLILDELSQLDPKEAGEAAYLLANGQGKTRATRTGNARPSAQWRLLFLSSGEESLASLMARAGRSPRAGQEVRLAEIDADAGCGMGIFEELHSYTSPATLANALKEAATKYHGAVGIEWLYRVVAEREKVSERVAEAIRQFVSDVAPPGAEGQVIRVARRFGLAAFAGELATEYGLTGWDSGDATEAARICFASWLESFGGNGNREERTILSDVKAFFERHEQDRFIRFYEDDDNSGEDFAAETQRVVNRAGYIKKYKNGDTHYLVLPEVFRREICAGHVPKAVEKVLSDAGWILPGTARVTQKQRVPGKGPTWCYVFTSKMWGAE